MFEIDCILLKPCLLQPCFHVAAPTYTCLYIYTFCMCVYDIYIYILYTYIHVCIHIYIYIYIYTHMVTSAHPLVTSALTRLRHGAGLSLRRSALSTRRVYTELAITSCPYQRLHSYPSLSLSTCHAYTQAQMLTQIE